MTFDDQGGSLNVILFNFLDHSIGNNQLSGINESVDQQAVVNLKTIGIVLVLWASPALSLFPLIFLLLCFLSAILEISKSWFKTIYLGLNQTNASESRRILFRGWVRCLCGVAHICTEHFRSWRCGNLQSGLHMENEQAHILF